MVKALMLEESDGKVSADFTTIDDNRLKERLPDGDVTVRVEYSTLNYKDGMVVNGIGRLVRDYPHIPGIDFAGEVEESDSPDFKPGDKVVLTGWRVGEAHWGGYAEKARVKASWLVPLPDGITTERAMAVGTAGFTAMLAIMALEDHGLDPSTEGEVLITGVSGGVGSVAAAILANLGYTVAGVTGRSELSDYLEFLGVSEIVARDELAEPSGRPLEKERWAGCIDAVGGSMLARVLAQMRYGRSVAAVGLAGGNKLETTVLPFLLRGVNLLGIDSVMCPFERRNRAWQRIAEELPAEKLDAMVQHAPLSDVPRLSKEILEGKVKGRMVIDVAG